MTDGASGARRLRVLHVVSSMAPEAGGPPVVAAGLAAALASRNHQVDIATLENPGQLRVTVDPSVTVHAFPHNNSKRYPRSAELARWLNERVGDYDVLHLHSLWQMPTWLASKAARKHGVPYVTLLHGMADRYSVHQRSALIKRIYWLFRERGIHSHAAALHFLNQAEMRNAMPWVASFPQFVLPNGISQAELDRLPAKGLFRASRPEIGGRPLALFLSRLHPKKGLDRLIPAWKAVVEKIPDSILAIAGTGDADYLARLDELITRNALHNHIVRVGQLVGEKKWQAIVDADVFVLPSHQEGFSMAITEALAAGCPVVATQECNFDELDPAAVGAPVPANARPCGIIIKNGDMPAFTDATIDLLLNPQKRAALAASARQLVQTQFTWEKVAETLEQLYYRMLTRKTSPKAPAAPDPTPSAR